MVQYCFTSTETIRLVRTESPGRLLNSVVVVVVDVDRFYIELFSALEYSRLTVLACDST